jgi:hypothetical protein
MNKLVCHRIGFTNWVEQNFVGRGTADAAIDLQMND